MLDAVKSKIFELISLYEKEKDRAENLTVALAEMEKELLDCRKQITDLNQQIDNLELMSAFLAGSDHREAKERVEKLIQEIDKCIRYLKV